MFITKTSLFNRNKSNINKKFTPTHFQSNSSQFIRKRVPPSFCIQRYYSTEEIDSKGDISWLKWLLTMKILPPKVRYQRSINVLSSSGTRGISDPEIKEHFDGMLKSKKVNFYPSLLLHLWSEPSYSTRLNFLFGHVFSTPHSPLMWELGATIFESDPTLKNFCQAQAWFTLAHIRTLQDYMCTKLGERMQQEDEIAPTVAEVFLTAYQFSIASHLESLKHIDQISKENIEEAREKTKSLFPNLLQQIIKPAIEGNIPVPHPGWISPSLYPSSQWKEKRKLALALHVSSTSNIEDFESDYSYLLKKSVDELLNITENTFDIDTLNQPLESMEILCSKYSKWKEATGSKDDFGFTE